MYQFSLKQKKHRFHHAEHGHLANFPCIQGDGTNDGLSPGKMLRLELEFLLRLDGLVGDMVEVE